MLPALTSSARTHPLPAVVGAELPIPVLSGHSLPHVNLDHAATTPCMESVQRAVHEFLPWYASVHRGAGFASQVSSTVHERAREVVRGFVSAPADAEVVFTRNTTDAFNLLARCLPPDTLVLRFDTEHHAALLPWNATSVVSLGTPSSPDEAIRTLERTLRTLPKGPKLVVLTGASNVTGERWPVAELAGTARRHGARTVLDAAQLAPHLPVHAAEWQLDWVAFSGHKIYAPYGAGALVGSGDWLRSAEPYLAGGGATSAVTRSDDGGLDVDWTEMPGRHEAGSPNVVGAHALATACAEIERYGWDAVAAHEQTLLARLRDGLASLPAVRTLALWPGERSVGVVSLAVDRRASTITDPGLIAAALAAEHAISVRSGLFCAHMLTRDLVEAAGSGFRGSHAVRVSIGIDTTQAHVERFLEALEQLVRRGTRESYRMSARGWVPTTDTRPFPVLLGGRAPTPR